MESQYIIKIGSKGEIFPPKEVRDYLELGKDQTVLMKVYPNRLIIQKIDSIDEILSKPAKTKISYFALKNMESEFD
jgi:bifunctional DNA-binding transcriptional regulator/antitoxin component of YhaV-PrlF toxin-antitoxin module